MAYSAKNQAQNAKFKEFFIAFRALAHALIKLIIFFFFMRFLVVEYI